MKHIPLEVSLFQIILIIQYNQSMICSIYYQILYIHATFFLDNIPSNHISSYNISSHNILLYNFLSNIILLYIITSHKINSLSKKSYISSYRICLTRLNITIP